MDDDAQLLRRLADGDRTAFEAIVRRHVDFVYATARRRVGDAHLAEDVTQAVFLILSQKAAMIAGRVVLVGWLYRTVGHVASNASKLRRRREHYERRAAAERSEQAMPTETPDEETLSRLDAALGALRPHSRDAVLLRFFRRQTFAEVGRALGISDEAAKKRVGRALDELRGQLAGVGSVAAVVAILDAAPASAAAPAALSQTILTTSAPSASAAALAKGTLVAVTTKQVVLTAAAAVALLLGGAGAVVLLAPAGAASTPPTAGGRLPVAAAVPAVADVPAGEGTLTAVLPEGTIELIAVGDVDDPRWWTPSGASSVPRPFGKFPGSVGPVAGKIARGIVFALDLPPNEHGPVTTAPWLEGSTTTATATLAGAGDGGPPKLMGQLSLVDPDRPMTLQFRLATGPWQTLATLDAAAPTTLPAADREPALLAPLAASGRGGTEARLWMAFGPSGIDRVVAVDRAGREHPMSFREVNRRMVRQADGTEQQVVDAHVDTRTVRPSEVVSLRVERRPYNRNVEFRDLALSRDAPTSPRVVVDGE